MLQSTRINRIITSWSHLLNLVSDPSQEGLFCFISTKKKKRTQPNINSVTGFNEPGLWWGPNSICFTEQVSAQLQHWLICVFPGLKIFLLFLVFLSLSFFLSFFSLAFLNTNREEYCNKGGMITRLFTEERHTGRKLATPRGRRVQSPPRRARWPLNPWAANEAFPLKHVHNRGVLPPLVFKLIWMSRVT